MYSNITPDFSEAPEFNNDQVQPGVYTTRVASYEMKTSKAGAPYISWKLVIYGAEGTTAKENNRPVFLATMLKGAGAGILKQFIVAVLGDLPVSFEANWPEQLLGKEVQVTLTKNIRPDGSEGFPNVRNPKAIKH